MLIGEIKFTLEAEAHLEEGEQMEDEEEEGIPKIIQSQITSLIIFLACLAVIASTEGEDGEKDTEEAGEIAEETTNGATLEPKEGAEKGVLAFTTTE